MGVSFVETILGRKKLTLFLGVAFGFSWLLVLPNLIGGTPLTTIQLIMRVLASFGPALAAIVVTRAERGRQEVILLLKSIIDFKGQAKWILIAIVLPVLVVFIPACILVYQGELSLKVIPVVNWTLLLPGFGLSLFFSGSIADEIGWRGYLLPQLQTRYTAFRSSIIIGLLWALWQLPTFYSAGVARSYISLIWLFLELGALSIILTWLYNSCKSLAVVILFNGTYRTLVSFLTMAVQLTGNAIEFQHLTATVLINTALVITLLCGGKTLVLKYKPRKSNR